MSICDKILIVVSVLNCLLSVFAVYAVRQGVKRKRKKEEYARARKNSRIQLTDTAVLVLVSAAKELPVSDRQEIIHVKGKLKNKSFEIA